MYSSSEYGQKIGELTVFTFLTFSLLTNLRKVCEYRDTKYYRDKTRSDAMSLQGTLCCLFKVCIKITY